MIAGPQAFLMRPAPRWAPVGAVVLLLLLGLLARRAAVLAGVLLVVFIAGIVSVWARGLSIDCGCFGDGGYDPDAVSKYPWEIARDVGLFIAAALVVMLPRTRFSRDSRIFAPTPEGPLHMSATNRKVSATRAAATAKSGPSRATTARASNLCREDFRRSCRGLVKDVLQDQRVFASGFGRVVAAPYPDLLKTKMLIESQGPGV